jgi:uncharacterized protein DUF2200
VSRIFTVSFASVYPLYLAKVEKKGRTQRELDAVIREDPAGLSAEARTHPRRPAEAFERAEPL